MQVFEDLRSAAATAYSIDVCSDNDRADLTFKVRMAISNVLTGFYNVTYTKVAKLIGRHYTTIVYYRKSHTKFYLSDDVYAEMYDYLSETAARSFHAEEDEDMDQILELIQMISD